jgi:hypothetical protein
MTESRDAVLPHRAERIAFLGTGIMGADGAVAVARRSLRRRYDRDARYVAIPSRRSSSL